ncbi:MAG TPA: helix-turn-helix domain-containing protein [Alphaproteobacteria bacterium]
MAADGRAARTRAVHDFKRAAIVEAARRVFAEHGLDGASVRLIARAAGYTPGAIYFYFPSKEHIYGDILNESLAALGRAVKGAAAAAPDAETRLRAAARAFFVYYRDHPDELELGLYLFQGIRRRGLTPELDRQLNGRLIAALRVLASALRDFAGLDDDAANLETVALASHIVGILFMDKSGRLETLGFAGEALVDHAIDTLVERLRRP